MVSLNTLIADWKASGVDNIDLINTNFGNLNNEEFVVVAPSSGVITPNHNDGVNFVSTITENSSLALISNLKAGQNGFILIIQGGTGLNTLGLASGYSPAGNLGIDLNPVAGVGTLIAYSVISNTGGSEIIRLSYQKNDALDAEVWITSDGVSVGVQAASELTGKVTFSGDVSYTNEYVRSGKSASIAAEAIKRSWTWDNEFILAPEDDWTFEAWLYNDVSIGDYILFLSGTDNQAWNPGDNRIYQVGAVSVDISPDNTPVGSWYHWMSKNIGGTLSFYINKDPTPIFTTPATKSLYGNGTAYLGTNSTGASPWRGAIDSLRLTASNVAIEDTLP